MLKQLMFALLFIVLAATLVSLPVSETQIRQVAQNIGLERSGNVVSIDNIEFLYQDSKSNIYLVHLRPQGFILLSADDAALPILGYDFDTKWNYDDLPYQLVSLIDNWKAQLTHIKEYTLLADAEIRSEWQRLNRSDFTPDRNFRNVSPLITSIWGQGTYYNALCPAGTPVGCVATAMAQIMRYWAHPTIGQGSHSYVHPVYGTQSADFGSTVYNWASMPNSLSSHNSAVATICRHAGVAVDMDYAPDGSGAYSQDVPPALINYFKYKSTTQYRSKSSYTAENWDILMRGELNNARPIYYSGYSAGSGGHAFILDGYTGTYPSTTYHVNWGWYGYYNGYYTLTALNPGSDNFNSGQAAVTGIEPQGSSPLLSEGFEGTTFPPTDWVRSNTNWTRTTTSTYIITGAASAIYTASGTISNATLRTPLLTLDGTVPLIFKGKRGGTGYNEVIQIQYSSDGTAWANVGSTHALTGTAQTFTQSLSSLTPGDYYLRFSCSSTNTTGQTKRFIIDDVTGPNLWVDPNPTAALNITAWAAGAIAPGEAVQSGAIFQLANVTGGTLSITSITNLSGTEFSTNLNTGVQLVTGQIHEFGFTYEPINYGTDNVTFQIVTNGGTVNINLSGSGYYSMFSDGFESYTDFALSFAPWTQYDGDGRPTYSIQDVTFTNQGYTGSYIIFNASQTTPSMAGTNLDAHTGAKFAACFDAVPSPTNNDWLISPALNFGNNPSISFWAKSYTAQYGLERFKVLWSNTGNAVANFGTNYLAGSATTYVEAPTTWTLYSYILPPACANATVHIAIQCVSNDAFVFMVDDFSASDDSAPPPPVFGHMSGYVYEYGSTNPIANALVQVGTKQVYTNTSGFYQMNNIVVGTHSANVSTPGRFYFSTAVSGIGITEGNTTSQNFFLTWSELAVNPTSISSSVYSSMTDDVSFTISNPGGTANLQYAMYFAPTNQSGRNTNALQKRPPAMDTANARVFRPTEFPSSERAEGWMTYTDPADADFYTYPVPERATKFTLTDFGMFAQGVTISKLRHYFYDVDANNWNGSNTYTFKIYGAEGSTLLYTSPTLTAINWPTANEHIIDPPITVPGDFWVSVRPGNQSNGAPYSIGTSASVGNTYNGEPGVWELDNTLDLILMAYIEGGEWVEASQYSGTVAPGGSQNLNIHFDSNGLTAGTHNAYLHIYNNSNYIAPSPGSSQVRGDVLIIPVSLEVTIPTEAMPVLNKSSWNTQTSSDTPSSSGDVYQLKNVGMTNLTITSASGLDGTPFSTNFNPAVVLGLNETHNFGFSFSPTSSGIYNATFTMVTNNGTKTINLKGYADYLFESFEGATFPPDGWNIVDNNSDTYNWYAYTATGAAHTGDKCAGSASWISGVGAVTPDNWLITPRLAISAGDEISWWVGAQDPAWPQEYYSVLISTTNNFVPSFTQVLFSETLTDGEWHYRSLSLNDYAGQNVYIAFRHHNCTDWYVLKIDDVMMPPLAAPLQWGNINGRVREQVTNNSIEGATITIGGRTTTTNETGYYEITDVVVESYMLSCSKTGYPTATVNVDILAGQTITQDIYMDWAEAVPSQINFTPNQAADTTNDLPLSVSNPGTIDLEWEADSGIWGGDEVLSGPLYQDWEDYDWTGWSGWLGPASDVYYNYGYEGGASGTFVFDSYYCSSWQWLITPKMHVELGSNFSFKYKQFNNSGEMLYVKISTATADTTDFTTNLAIIGPMSDTNWHSFDYDLSPWAGSDVYLAFHYKKVLTQYAYVFIDMITGPSAYMAPKNWLSAVPEEGTVRSGDAENIALRVNTNGMEPGTYTAQTWLFSNGKTSPNKLYVTLTVFQADAATPEEVGIDIANGDVTISWAESDNAQQYKIYVAGSIVPFEQYTHIRSTDQLSATITQAQLVAAGITGDKCFFRVTADNQAMRVVNVAQSRRRSNPLGLEKLRKPEGLKLQKLQIRN